VTPYAFPVQGRTTINGDSPVTDTSNNVLFVDFKGVRRSSETHGLRHLIYTQAGTPSGFIAIHDAALIDKLGRRADYDRLAQSNGPYYKADALEILAKYIGVDEPTFLATVSHYNDLCTAGRDTDFQKDPSLLVPVTQGPFYAVRYTFVANDMSGGVRTNLKHQVTRVDGSVIPNLYASGLTTSRNYYDGIIVAVGCLQIASTTGRIAAESVAEQLAAAR
jgi:hypothetical protein